MTKAELAAERERVAVAERERDGPPDAVLLQAQKVADAWPWTGVEMSESELSRTLRIAGNGPDPIPLAQAVHALTALLPIGAPVLTTEPCGTCGGTKRISDPYREVGMGPVNRQCPACSPSGQEKA